MIVYERNLKISHKKDGWYLIERPDNLGRYLYNKTAGKLARIPNISDGDLSQYVKNVILSEKIEPMHIYSPKEFIAQKKVPRLMIYLTASCNLNCIYCHCNSGGPSGEMSDKDMLNTVKKYIDYATERNPNNKEIAITFMGGGEPLLKIKGIKLITEYIQKIGFTGAYTLVTNGTVASDRDWDWLLKNHFSITISADGPPAIQDKQRPFHKKRANTAEFLERRLLMLGNKSASINIRSTVMDASKEAIDSICDYFSGFQAVSTHHLEPLSPAGRALGLSSKKEFYQSFFAHYAPYLYTNPSRYKSSWFKPFNRSNAFCGAVYYNTIVTHDGYVSLCSEVDSSMKDTDYGKKYIVAHVDDGNPFESKGAEEFSLENTSAELTKCNVCIMQFKCGGGCYIKRDRDYPDEWKTFTNNYCDQIIPLNISYLIGLYENQK